MTEHFKIPGFQADDPCLAFDDSTENMNYSFPQTNEEFGSFSNNYLDRSLTALPGFADVLLPLSKDPYDMSSEGTRSPFASDLYAYNAIQERFTSNIAEAPLSSALKSSFDLLASSSSEDVEIIHELKPHLEMNNDALTSSSSAIGESDENLNYGHMVVPESVAFTSNSKEASIYNAALSPFTFTKEKFEFEKSSMDKKSNNVKPYLTVIKAKKSKYDFSKDSLLSITSVQSEERGRKPSKNNNLEWVVKEQNVNPYRWVDPLIIRREYENEKKYFEKSGRGRKRKSSTSSVENVEILEKRMKSTLAERKRRHRMKDFLVKLRCEVPGVRDNPKTSQEVIFRAAADYIRRFHSLILRRGKDNESNSIGVWGKGDSKRRLSTSPAENDEVTDRNMKALAERNRRRRLKDSLEQLRIVVPGVKDNPKASQVSIIKLAAEYIRILRKMKKQNTNLLNHSHYPLC